MTSKSKNKGNKLERDFRDELNKAFNCEEFARTPGSGALMGLSNARKNAGLEHITKQTLGSDLICPKWFKWSVECKNYADDPNYSKLIKDDDRVLNGWLGEALFDAETLNLSPMLVFRTNRKGTHVAIPSLFPLPESITHYVKYDSFWILGLEAFITNINEFNDYNEDNTITINDWVKDLDRNKFLVSSMLEVKEKKTKPKKKKI